MRLRPSQVPVRASDVPGQPAHADLLAKAGWHAVRVSHLTDPGEQEAEQLADTLSSGGPGGNESRPYRTGADVGTVHRAEVSPGMESGASVEAPTGGRALDAGTRAWFEPRLGTLLGDVRIHTDGSAAEAARHLNARAFTIGRHIGFGAGEYAPGTAGGHRLLAHELVHVVQQSSARRTVPLVSRAPVPPGHQPAQASPPAPAVSREFDAGIRDVNAAIGLVFDNQKTGLGRLKDALHEQEKASVIALLAGLAVGTAIGILLGPVEGFAVGALIESGIVDEAGRYLIEKATEGLIDKAREHVADETEKWANDKLKKSKSDAVYNLIEAHDKAINRAKADALKGFSDSIKDFDPSPSGVAALRQLEKAFRERAELSADVQVASSAGAWASHVAAEQRERIFGVPDTRAWVNSDHESYSQEGALEIGARVEKAPLFSSADIKIVDSKWRGINKETQRVVQEHSGAKIGQLDAPLRITVETPVGSTRCYYVPNHIEDLLFPENTIGQSVWIWLGSGKLMPSPGPEYGAAVMSEAAAFGYHVSEKSTGELSD
jgi:Domain of unknown function (DUF4157)